MRTLISDMELLQCKDGVLQWWVSARSFNVLAVHQMSVGITKHSSSPTATVRIIGTDS